jgi:hypothetical protein
LATQKSVANQFRFLAFGALENFPRATPVPITMPMTAMPTATRLLT